MNLRPATLADVPDMIELERSCPTAGHWTESQYQQGVRPGDQQRFVLVAEGPVLAPKPGQEQPVGLLGFLVACHLAPDWELENIVVAPAARRKGLGKSLVDALVARAREADSESVFLEVRESNAAARKLYERAGFKQTGRRKAYYADPTEDAILYNLQVAAPK